MSILIWKIVEAEYLRYVFRAGDVPDLTADPTLAKKILGFEAKQDLDAMCRDLWNWQTKNPNGYADAE
jgi:UDP-glucose 4-epimerase